MLPHNNNKLATRLLTRPPETTNKEINYRSWRVPAAEFRVAVVGRVDVGQFVADWLPESFPLAVHHGIVGLEWLQPTHLAT